MESEEIYINYFKRSFAENSIFWARFPGIINLEGKSILDIGCGDGALCVDMAFKGANKVTGIDTNKNLIKFAIDNVSLRYSGVKDIVNFKLGEINSLPYSEFDIITSKSAFEHIMEPAKCLEEIGLRLKPGGKVYIGFGPLYRSPFGDHGISKPALGVRIPWAQVFLPERFIISQWNKKHPEKKVTSIFDFGLNKLSMAQFKEMFYKSKLEVLYFSINSGTTVASKVFSLIRRIPFISEYFSYNIYCILKKL